jgi:hypothetical protein
VSELVTFRDCHKIPEITNLKTGKVTAPGVEVLAPFLLGVWHVWLEG